MPWLKYDLRSHTFEPGSPGIPLAPSAPGRPWKEYKHLKMPTTDIQSKEKALIHLDFNLIFLPDICYSLFCQVSHLDQWNLEYLEDPECKQNNL